MTCLHISGFCLPARSKRSHGRPLTYRKAIEAQLSKMGDGVRAAAEAVEEVGF